MLLFVAFSALFVIIIFDFCVYYTPLAHRLNREQQKKYDSFVLYIWLYSTTIDIFFSFIVTPVGSFHLVQIFQIVILRLSSYFYFQFKSLIRLLWPLKWDQQKYLKQSSFFFLSFHSFKWKNTSASRKGSDTNALDTHLLKFNIKFLWIEISQ